MIVEWADTMAGVMGIKIISNEDGRVEASMPVTSRTCQVTGVLHGGASLALAETVAGCGSVKLISDEEFPYGVSVTGNHLRTAPLGSEVRAVGTLLHKGKTMHTWNVDILDEEGNIISTERVVNKIGKKH